MDEQSAKIIQTNLVRDDNGAYWVYGEGWMRCVGDDDPQGGYEANSFAEMLKKLIKMGHISEPFYIDWKWAWHVREWSRY